MFWYNYVIMEKSIRVGAWNLRGALSDSDRAESVVDTIPSLGAHIVALPDSWHEDSKKSEPTTRRLLIDDTTFRKIGYTPLHSIYCDGRADDNYARYGFTTLVHHTIDVIDHEILPLGERPADLLHIQLGNHTLNVISLYLDDRSEAIRLKQTNDLLDCTDEYRDHPTVLMGDFNAMHAESSIAQTLQKPLSRATIGRLPLLNRTGPRLVEMASGKTLQILQDAGFRDIESQQTPTMPALLPLFQLDHILISDGNDTSLTATPTTRMRRLYLSDHLAIASTIHVEEK